MNNEAPINEVLAAGMLALANWNGERDFIDPMCGSGTTGGACEKLNRKCTLIDQNSHVVDIVQSRFN